MCRARCSARTPGTCASSGAPELLAAYAATPPTLRRSILKLVVEIAKDRRSRPAEDPPEDTDVAAPKSRRPGFPSGRGRPVRASKRRRGPKSES